MEALLTRMIVDGCQGTASAAFASALAGMQQLRELTVPEITHATLATLAGLSRLEWIGATYVAGDADVAPALAACASVRRVQLCGADIWHAFPNVSPHGGCGCVLSMLCSAALHRAPCPLRLCCWHTSYAARARARHHFPSLRQLTQLQQSAASDDSRLQQSAHVFWVALITTAKAGLATPAAVNF